jgi:hypothetical protein
MGFFPPGIKKPGREVDHSPPSNAEVKNDWRCTSASPICLYAMKRDNFILLPLYYLVYFDNLFCEIM